MTTDTSPAFLYVWLAAATAATVLGAGAYMFVYAAILDWRNKVGLNAWLGGVAALLVGIASAIFLVGHYQGATDYDWALFAACIAFTLIAVVWIVRTVLVWKISHDDKQGRKQP